MIMGLLTKAQEITGEKTFNDDVIIKGHLVLKKDFNWITSGSNANGSWIKFGDGTMICWISANITCSSSVSNVFGSTSGTTYYNTGAWTFPVEFVAAPTLCLTPGTNVNSARLVYSGTVSATTANWVAVTEVNNGQVRAHLIAIGRWKA